MRRVLADSVLQPVRFVVVNRLQRVGGGPRLFGRRGWALGVVVEIARCEDQSVVPDGPEVQVERLRRSAVGQIGGEPYGPLPWTPRTLARLSGCRSGWIPGTASMPGRRRSCRLRWRRAGSGVCLWTRRRCSRRRWPAGRSHRRSPWLRSRTRWRDRRVRRRARSSRMRRASRRGEPRTPPSALPSA